ncbi:hypothetical protein [uncultured Clostridium sp.]|jgi:hypothetical protein|uniref:hypothetical protein n=1 Tax=uncultured Clostridium sp. TaxID=59620 RepID=UPI0026288047|nr:hypothetical protein [uncultured Clostridium sp.]
MSNRDLENIGIEKDIAISMTKELGSKISEVIKSNFLIEKDDESRDFNIIDDLKKIEVKEAFKLEEER